MVNNNLIYKYIEKEKKILVVVCTVVIIFYILNIMISQVFNGISEFVYNDWTPQLKDLLQQSYNQALITYINILLIVFLVISYKYVINNKIKYYIKNYIYRYTSITTIISLILLLNANSYSINKYISAILLIISFFILLINSQKLIQIIGLVLSKSYTSFKIIMVFIMLMSSYLLVDNWYPIKIPNNYQLIDKTYINNNNEKLSQEYVSKCIKNHRDEESKKDKFTIDQKCNGIDSKIINGLRKTSQIEMGQDGILYHHSFIYLPALHIIKYGVNDHFPYLYGIGNTFFTSLLMQIFGENWTGYFKSYPIGQLIGLISIMLLMLSLTRNLIPSLVSGLIVLFFIGIIKFEFVLLAPGFNPIRYLGICIQLAALNYYNKKNNSFRFFILLASSTLGIIWNFELGVFGIISQISLILMRDKLLLNTKIVKIFILVILIILGSIFTRFITGDYIQTMHLAIFGLFSYLDTIEFLTVLLFVVLYAYIYIKLTNKYFESNDRSFRYSILILSTLIFIKYIFYPVKVHLYASLMIPAVLLITAFKWDKLENNKNSCTIKFVLLLVSLITFYQSALYWNKANKFVDLTMNRFVQYKWTELGDGFLTSIPEENLVKRINSIRRNTLESDVLLILSPYDHLIFSYLNHKKLCGHFELNLNLLTFTDINKVKNCVKETKDIVIVLDQDLNRSCVNNIFNDANKCKVYNLTKFGPRAVFTDLEKNLELIESDGPLTFYKYKND